MESKQRGTSFRCSGLVPLPLKDSLSGMDLISEELKIDSGVAVISYKHHFGQG